MTPKEIPYIKAIEEIESILATIENQELDVDDLADKLKRVTELIRLCKRKLRATNDQVEKILSDMEE